MSQLLMASVKL